MESSKIDENINDELILSVIEELDRKIRAQVYEDLKVSESSGDKERTKADLECERRKTVALEVLISSVQIQRLYFVVRSVILGLFSAILTLGTIAVLGTIDLIQAIILGVFVFTFSLVASRLLDKQIVKVSRKIVSILSKRKRIRDFVLKNF
jgi:hypothetical protein